MSCSGKRRCGLASSVWRTTAPANGRRYTVRHRSVRRRANGNVGGQPSPVTRRPSAVTRQPELHHATQQRLAAGERQCRRSAQAGVVRDINTSIRGQGRETSGVLLYSSAFLTHLSHRQKPRPSEFLLERGVLSSGTFRVTLTVCGARRRPPLQTIQPPSGRLLMALEQWFPAAW